jgi:predicted peroxiredoxin
MMRRQLLAKVPQWFGFSLLGLNPADAQLAPGHKPLKIMMKSAWGSDDPTRASFTFEHALALAEAGHNEVQIFLTGEATYLMRKATAIALFPVGWPPLSETLAKIAKGIPIFS